MASWESEQLAATADVIGRLSPETRPRFWRAIGELRERTSAHFRRTLEMARLVGNSRPEKDVDVAIHPFSPLDEELNALDEEGRSAELSRVYPGLDAAGAMREYVDRLDRHFSDPARRQVATVIQNDFFPPGHPTPDIVDASVARALLRDVHAANIPSPADGHSGMLSEPQMRSFLAGLRHDDPLVQRGLHPGDTYWLHGHAYDAQVRQFAEQLFAALRFGVFLEGPSGDEDREDEDDELRGRADAVRAAIEELGLLEETGIIRHGIVWDQHRRRRRTKPGSVSAQLTKPGSVVLPHGGA